MLSRDPAKRALHPVERKRREAVLSFFILFPFVLALLGCALALGIEPRMMLERTAERMFRVTGSNQFAGAQFYSKTIHGVQGVSLSSASRNRSTDSIEERNRQAKRKRLDFVAKDGAVLSWGRIADSRLIDDFMRGNAPTLSLADSPPPWRMALSWFCVGLGGLTFVGVIQNSFFPKKGILP